MTDLVFAAYVGKLKMAETVEPNARMLKNTLGNNSKEQAGEKKNRKAVQFAICAIHDIALNGEKSVSGRAPRDAIGA